jgi:hypothetical protein
MSRQASSIVSGQLIIWGVIALGLYAAFQAGNIIADGGFGEVFLYIAGTLWVLAVITIRRFWWIPLFIFLVIGFSSTALGFKIQGTDISGALGLSCLMAMLSMGQLKQAPRERNLGIFFYLTMLYVGGHTVIYGINNYFSGDTQFKNIVKAYYGAFIPLVFLWLIDAYAQGKGLKKAVNAQIILSLLFALIAVVVTFFLIPIPFISGDTINFSWADPAGAAGFLRWTILPVFMLAVCLAGSSRGQKKIFYRLSAVLLLCMSIFGGGRVGLLMMVLFLLVWMALRGKWRQLVISGWLIVIAGGGLFIMGHTIDAKVLQGMPEGLQKVQRAISIFMPADQQDDSQIMTEGSNQWHQDLVNGAWEAATKDMTTFLFGNGFKGWDDSIDMKMFTYGAAYETAVKMAVRMGATETHFFSILTIFGLTGVLFYYGFMIEVLRRTLRVMKKCPEGSFAQTLCVFSASLLIVTLLVSPIGGAIPSYNMIYWMVGCLAAEPYLARVHSGKGSLATPG